MIEDQEHGPRPILPLFSYDYPTSFYKIGLGNRARLRPLAT